VSALKDSPDGYPSRLRAALVIAQVALSLVLLVGAGLLLRSLRSVLLNPGYEQSRIAHFRLRPSRLGYDAQKSQAYHRQVIRRLETMPEVQSVVVAKVPPNSAWGNVVRVSLPGHAPVRQEDALRVDSNDITPGFFEAMSIPLNGRDFDEGDQKGAPLVAIVNETLARRLWSDNEFRGASLIIEGKEYSVIGIAKDTHPRKSDEGPTPFLYRAYWQTDGVDSRLFVRVAGDPQTALFALRREVAAVDPDVHIGQEMSLSKRMELSFESERLMSSTLNCSGALALFLSLIGLYGVLAQRVSQRTREIGIRIALGAEVKEVLKWVLRQGLHLALTGIAVGVAAALVLTRVLSSYLYGIAPHDPLTFIIISLSLIVVAMAACYIPARRAARVDPMVALRYE
jgi:predicted permease